MLDCVLGLPYLFCVLQYKQMGELGLMGIVIPEEYGGTGVMYTL